MKFSDETISILKNMAQINPSIVLRKGNTIRTVSPSKTIMSKAVVGDEFEEDAGIFDLSKFIALLSFFEEPDISFNGDRFVIGSGKQKSVYTYTPEGMIVTPPNNEDINMPEPEAKFDVRWKDIETVIKAASILGLPEVVFISDGDKIEFAAINSENPTSNSYSVTLLEDFNGPKFKLFISTNNMLMMNSDYRVSLSVAGIVHFKAKNIEYWIATSSK